MTSRPRSESSAQLDHVRPGERECSESRRLSTYKCGSRNRSSPLGAVRQAAAAARGVRFARAPDRNWAHVSASARARAAAEANARVESGWGDYAAVTPISRGEGRARG